VAQKTTHWYIEPITDLTNEALAAALAALGQASVAETTITVQGVEKRVYGVLHQFVTKLARSTAHCTTYRVYVREGNGEPRPWNLANKQNNKGRKTKKYREIERQLAQKKANE
jgi:hypothetical protein